MVKKSQRGGKVKVTKGSWSAEEDKKLVNYVISHGDKKWRTLPLKAGLNRCGKSCRLRWLNYLRPGIKRGNISEDEEDLIIRLHNLLGNRWSIIAGRIPGRTDNEIKNHWNTHLRKRSLTIDDLNNKHNHNLDEISLLPPREVALNSSPHDFPIMETPGGKNSPAMHVNETNVVVSSCMEQPSLEFDIQQFLGFVPMPDDHYYGSSSDVGLEDYGISELDSNLQNPIRSDLSSNINSQKCWDSLLRSHTFEFDDFDQFSDRYYGLFSPLLGQ